MVFIDLRWKLFSKRPSKLYTFLPINDGNQVVKSSSFTKKPNNLIKENFYSYALFHTKNDFEVKANIELDLKRISSFKEKNNHQFFLKKQSSLLMNKTKKLVNGLATAREVYDWIVNNTGPIKGLIIYYKDLLESNLIDLKRALKGKSMCGGKSALFVSMCRNIGIPARVVSGYFLKDGWTLLKNAKQHSQFMDLHMWAEFYDKGFWCPVDINVAQQLKKDYFRTFPDKIFNFKDRRVVISKGSNFSIEKKNLDFLQTAYYTKGSNLKMSIKIKK